MEWRGKTLWLPQERGLNECESAQAQGERRLCVTAPTGAGKTLMMGYRLDLSLQRGRRSVLYTNRRMLLDQTINVLTNFGLPFGVRASGHDDLADCEAPIQLAMLQTEQTRLTKRVMHQLFPADDVLIDEAHGQANGAAEGIINQHVENGASVIGFTATPLGLKHLYNRLIVAGVTSELRDCGALVLCHVYGPDEPKAALTLKRTKTGEYTEGDVVKAMMSPTIFGRVLEHYNRLNRDRMPSVLFGPGVKESLWFAQQFSHTGIRAAHIDGEHIWIDGEEHATSQALKDELAKESRDGLLPIVCNRFVLREGIDWPWLQHGILATVFGSVVSYIQCLDEKTEILTLRGFLGPDEISDDDCVAAFNRKTGDIEWSSILSRVDRALGQDERMFSICGPSIDIRVTDGHNMVYKVRTTGAGKKWRWPSEWSLKQAGDLSQNYSFQIPVSGMRHSPGVHLTDDELRFIGWFVTDGTRNRANQQVVITQAVHQPQITDLRKCLLGCGFNFKEYRITPRDGFKNGHDQIRFSIPKGTKTKSLARHGWVRLQEFLDKDLSLELVLKATPQQFDVLIEAIHLGDGAKQRGQTWTRRSYHISTGNLTFAERLQQLAVVSGYRASIAVEIPRLPGWKPRYVVHLKKVSQIVVGGANGKDRSVLNQCDHVAGERVWCVENEFGTIVIRRNGKVAIVGNSVGRLLRAYPGVDHVTLQDHGGNWWRHGSPNADRVWDLGIDAARYASEREQRIREKKEAEPIVCPKCGAVRLHGASCATCGHKASAKVRPVIQTDGSLSYLKGDIFKERPVQVKSDTQRQWDDIFWRFRKSGKTYRQAEGYFFHQHGYYPPRTLERMPMNGEDWHANIQDVPWDRVNMPERKHEPSLFS